MRVLSCIGARPQFVKAAVLNREMQRRGMTEIFVHTGQHYDALMSDVFFAELGLPKPSYELGVGSANHGAQTGEMLKRLELVLLDEAPDVVVVYGDTNSTLAGALAAAKLHIPLAHVEAGLRSYDRSMPEEINRVITDHVSDVLFAPNRRAALQLAGEGIKSGVHVVGDLMVDLARAVAAVLPERPEVLKRLALHPGEYGVATIHRAANTDDAVIFGRLIEGLRRVGYPIVFPIHPRTSGVAEGCGVGRGDNITTIDPLSYMDMMALMSRARTIFTDSGGIQKEAYVLRVPCVTMRADTEWTETVDGGWNVLAGSDPDTIVAAADRAPPATQEPLYGEGAAAKIVSVLLSVSRGAGVDGLVGTSVRRPS
jgi:UDP-N-acetylglucosamine 2-epimerase